MRDKKKNLVAGEDLGWEDREKSEGRKKGEKKKMSAKIVYSMSDENGDLQKQIGCMNGIFQLFDRHHFLSSSKRVLDQNKKRLAAGQNDGQGTQPSGTKETKQKKTIKEKHRNSTESSRTSFSSSSCSSSFSSSECNRQPHPEMSNFPRTPSRDLPMYQMNDSLQLPRQPVDFRDVVKDSMYRETREISIKTATKANAGGQTLKYMDSPRPLPQTKPVNCRVSGPNNSCQVVSKQREVLKDGPRFSYDGRESRFKSMAKVKELPRLSLDSRVRSMKNRDTGEQQRSYENCCNNMIQPEPGSNRRPSSVVAKLMGLEAFPDSMSTDESQPSPAKTFPEVEHGSFSRLSKKPNENKQIQMSSSPRNSNKGFTSPRMRNVDSVKKPNSSPKIPIEPAPWKQVEGIKGQTPPLNSGETLAKVQHSPVSSVYGEIEKRLAQLEFKKSGKDLRALKQILEAMRKTKEVFESRREDEASDLESQSGYSSSVDQSRRLTNSDGLKCCNTTSNTNKGANSPKSCEHPIVIMRAAKFNENTRNLPSRAIPPESLPRPQRLKVGPVDKQMTRDQTPRGIPLKDIPSQPICLMDRNTSAKTLKLTQTVTTPHPPAGKNKLGKSSDPMGLQLQQKNQGLKKQPYHANTSSDLSRTRRQPIQAGSPRRNLRPKSSIFHQRDEQLSDTSSDARHSISHNDASSQQSESNISMGSQNDAEVTSVYRSDKIISMGSQNDAEVTSSYRSDKINSTGLNHYQEDLVAEDILSTEPAKPAPEQPSPVSVLDATFYRDEPPSPVRKISHAFKDDQALSSDEVEWSLRDLDHSSNSRKPSLGSEDDYKKEENTQPLIQIVMHTNSLNESSITSEIAPIYNSTDPSHRYISEILLASGLLSDFEFDIMAIKLHRSGHVINPDLFFVLEQTKATTGLFNEEHNDKKITHAEPIFQKAQRKLIFDAVDEILVQNLKSEYSSKQRLSVSKLADNKPTRQQFLRYVCSEVDLLQAKNSKCSFDDDNDYFTSIIREDLMHEARNWTDCRTEISWLVLDVERLIFKDLISEIVTDNTVGGFSQPGRLCRQLFSK